MEWKKEAREQTCPFFFIYLIIYLRGDKSTIVNVKILRKILIESRLSSYNKKNSSYCYPIFLKPQSHERQMATWAIFRRFKNRLNTRKTTQWNEARLQLPRSFTSVHALIKRDIIAGGKGELGERWKRERADVSWSRKSERERERASEKERESGLVRKGFVIKRSRTRCRRPPFVRALWSRHVTRETAHPPPPRVCDSFSRLLSGETRPTHSTG